MSPAALGGFITLCLGLLLIVAGALMHILDWQTERARQRQARVRIEAQGVAKSINALTKLVNALKGHTQGFQVMVLGIVVLLIGAGLLGGSSIL